MSSRRSFLQNLETALKSDIPQKEIPIPSKTTPNFYLSEKPIPLSDKIYSNFLKMLTVSKIKEFTENCKQKEIDSQKRNMRLKKNTFIQIMKSTFSQEEIYSNLYEQIFNRFKVYKAEIRCHNHKNDNYFLGKITAEDEIEIYDICCAFAIFVKCDFEHKMKLLFDITDIDDDGFVNENEIKKMIYSINYLFSDENSTNNYDSSLITQSISSLNALKGIRMLLKYPGNLEKVFYEEKYINFQQFYKSVLKVFNYKYDLLPIFVSFKKCLLTMKKEKKFEIKDRNYSDFASISNEIVSSIKFGNDIGKTYYDFKKSLERKNVDRKLLRMQTRKTQFNNIKKDNLSKKGKIAFSKRLFESSQTIKRNKEIKDDLYSINYNKICGLETYPGRLKIIETTPNPNINNNNDNKLLLFGKGTLNHALGKNTGYMTLEEILAEITMLANKHKIDDLIHDEMLRIETKIMNKANKMCLKLKDRAPFQNLVIGKVDLPKEKEGKNENKEGKENNNNEEGDIKNDN